MASVFLAAGTWPSSWKVSLPPGYEGVWSGSLMKQGYCLQWKAEINEAKDSTALFNESFNVHLHHRSDFWIPVVYQRPLKDQLFEVYTGTIWTGKCMSVALYTQSQTSGPDKGWTLVNWTIVQEVSRTTFCRLSQISHKFLLSWNHNTCRTWDFKDSRGKNKASVLLGNLENQPAPLSPNSVLAASHSSFSSPPQRDSAHLSYPDLLSRVLLASGQYWGFSCINQITLKPRTKSAMIPEDMDKNLQTPPQKARKVSVPVSW